MLYPILGQDRRTALPPDDDPEQEQWEAGNVQLHIHL